MAGLRSNQAWVALGKQSAKGTPATAAKIRSYLSSNDRVMPRGEFAQFPETDAGRAAPDSHKVTGGSEGSFQVGARDSLAHTIFEAAQGDKVSAGPTNFTHTSVGADALSYYTVWGMLSNTLWERFDDLLLNELTISAEAAGFLTIGASWMGRAATRLTASPGAGIDDVALPADAVYQYNDVTVEVGGAATSLVRSVSASLNNNLAMQQTDDFVPYDVHTGFREVTGGFDMIFETLDEYERFHYGAVDGTTQSNVTATTTVKFTFSKGANNKIIVEFPLVNYEEYPISQDTGGDPIIVAARFRTRRNATGQLKTVVHNQVAT